MTDAATKGRVLIAGGSGFIGRRLAAELSGAGYEVVVLTRAAGRPPIGPIRFVQWPAVSAGAGDPWTEALEGSHAVINLCGASIGGPRWTAPSLMAYSL